MIIDIKKEAHGFVTVGGIPHRHPHNCNHTLNTLIITSSRSWGPERERVCPKCHSCELWQNKVSHTSGFFRFITPRQHYCGGLEIYSTSWKIFEIIWLFHISKLEAQLDSQEPSAWKQTLQREDSKTGGRAPLHSPPHPGLERFRSIAVGLQNP